MVNNQMGLLAEQLILQLSMNLMNIFCLFIESTKHKYFISSWKNFKLLIKLSTNKVSLKCLPWQLLLYVNHFESVELNEDLSIKHLGGPNSCGKTNVPEIWNWRYNRIFLPSFPHPPSSSHPWPWHHSYTCDRDRHYQSL